MEICELWRGLSLTINCQTEGNGMVGVYEYPYLKRDEGRHQQIEVCWCQEGAILPWACPPTGHCVSSLTGGGVFLLQSREEGLRSRLKLRNRQIRDLRRALRK